MEGADVFEIRFQYPTVELAYLILAFDPGEAMEFATSQAELEYPQSSYHARQIVRIATASMPQLLSTNVTPTP